MEQIEKIEYLNHLFSYYGVLLTDKQREYFTNYYHLDLSLFEIAESFGVSRNAVFDQLKKTEQHLLDFEQKLGLFKLSQKRIDLIEKYVKTQDMKYIEELRKLDE
ncbi:putative DNA-binding protein [Acholeplasma oculi]|uniref:UPF0122 protein Aocu_10910 n=1 Tax=Acholeplasma oculi TaxID=35623 RepID=A0A061ACM6_9MOLU|nr:hypothetical protein [Acholeplasma oculi]CDR31164.1 Putative helix-turn-helix protein, YlxM/p13-like [Acholeplasma oculi]SKC37639.1 hypothetical protein SAMN02745122_0521 [Acholeplasma oculi]SUT91008.1 putative DNA-binding protein [Acholeplasma oculi]